MSPVRVRWVRTVASEALKDLGRVFEALGLDWWVHSRGTGREQCSRENRLRDMRGGIRGLGGGQYHVLLGSSVVLVGQVTGEGAGGLWLH